MSDIAAPYALPMNLGAEIVGRSGPVVQGSKVEPFTPIDPMRQASKAYALADQMREQDLQQQAQQDQQTIQDALNQGANMQTPDGIQQMAESLKGRVSPKTYQGLLQMHAKVVEETQASKERLMRADEMQLKKTLQQSEVVSQSLSSVMSQYEQTVESKGVPGAVDEFEKNKQVAVQSLLQTQAITPQQAEELAKMSPGQVKAKIDTSKYWTDHIKGVAEEKMKLAQAREHEARASMFEQGGAGMAAYNAAVEQYGADSPQAKAMLQKAQGSGGGRVGVDEASVKPEERRLAVGQWIQNPSSLRGLDPTYQRNVIKWAADLGITQDDVASGQARRKFDLAAATTSGHRAGAMAAVEATMPGLIDEALDASKNVPRGNFVPLNKLMQMGEGAISDPALRRFKIANQSVASEFQQVIARGGSNVTSLNEAMSLLQTADSPEAYASALKQLRKEVDINVKGAEQVRKNISGKSLEKLTPAKEAGLEDLRQHVNGLRAQLQDTVPGSTTYQRVESMLAEAEKELGGVPPKPAETTPVGPKPSATSTGKLQVRSPEDLKVAFSSGKIKVGDRFVGPDGVERVLKREPQ